MKEFKIDDYKLIILNKIDDYNLIKSYSHDIFFILKNAYESIGSCTIYKSINHMVKSVSRYKLIIKDDIIYAVSTYNLIKQKNSYKCTLIGGNTQLNKVDVNNAVKWLIKSDIINFKHLYWIEASGVIKHWEEKFGGYKIPNVYVEAILNIPIEKIDEYSYKRYISGIDDPIEKTMFGFDSLETLNNLLDKTGIYQYENYVRQMYNGEYNLYEAYSKKSRYYQILHLIEFVIQEFEEGNQFFNITKNTYLIIKKAINEIKIFNKKLKDFDISCKIDYVEWILGNANIITPHKLF